MNGLPARPLGGGIMKQWSLFIDIEGFSKIYQAEKAKACKLLSGLMLDLYNIGTRIYPDYYNRLFIHQFGDGFIICPNPWDLNLAKPISIAIALMQATALRGGFARAAISHGEMADILGWYPKEIRANLEGNYIVSLELGIMTIIPVMGDALINAYALSKCKPKGPRLLLDKEFESQLQDIKVSTVDRYDDHIGIDWMHSEISLVSDILKKIDIDAPSSKDLEEIVRNYITSNNKLSDEWKKSAEILIRGGKPSDNKEPVEQLRKNLRH